jgi:hypothetical protein
VVLAGSGFYITGLILLLRMIRDWNSGRRAGADAAAVAASAARVLPGVRP